MTVSSGPGVFSTVFTTEDVTVTTTVPTTAVTTETDVSLLTIVASHAPIHLIFIRRPPLRGAKPTLAQIPRTSTIEG